MPKQNQAKNHQHKNQNQSLVCTWTNFGPAPRWNLSQPFFFLYTIPSIREARAPPHLLSKATSIALGSLHSPHHFYLRDEPTLFLRKNKNKNLKIGRHWHHMINSYWDSYNNFVVSAIFAKRAKVNSCHLILFHPSHIIFLLTTIFYLFLPKCLWI